MKMKKAILITGIIWLVLIVAGAITEVIFGISFLTTLQSGSVSSDANIPQAIGNFVVAAFLIAGAVLDIIMLLKRNSDMKKAPGIVLGVFAAVFGATVPGILFAIDSGMNRSEN